MNTSIKHEDLIIYIGLGKSKAILLYPFWSFKDRGKVGLFGQFKVPRGEGAHLGLFGFHWFSQPCRLRAVTKSLPMVASGEFLPGFTEPDHGPVNVG